MRQTNRKLGTILFVDIVDSTGKAAKVGDEKWNVLLGQFESAARKNLDDHGGHLVKTTGDGLLALFDGPARAIRCGSNICGASRKLGLASRCGVHTAEIEEHGADIAGIGVHIAARIVEAAQSGEVWTSRTVRDLVSGAGIEFHERGHHNLKGIEEPVALFAATV